MAANNTDTRTEHDPCKCCGAEMETYYKYCETCVQANCDMHTARCGDEPEDRTDDNEPPIGGGSPEETDLSQFGGGK